MNWRDRIQVGDKVEFQWGDEWEVMLVEEFVPSVQGEEAVFLTLTSQDGLSSATVSKEDSSLREYTDTSDSNPSGEIDGLLQYRLLLAEPSLESWQGLQELLIQGAASSNAELVRSYALDHLKAWPKELLRRCLNSELKYKEPVFLYELSTMSLNEESVQFKLLSHCRPYLESEYYKLVYLHIPEPVSQETIQRVEGRFGKLPKEVSTFFLESNGFYLGFREWEEDGDSEEWEKVELQKRPEYYDWYDGVSVNRMVFTMEEIFFEGEHSDEFDLFLEGSEEYHTRVFGYDGCTSQAFCFYPEISKESEIERPDCIYSQHSDYDWEDFVDAWKQQEDSRQMYSPWWIGEGNDHWIAYDHDFYQSFGDYLLKDFHVEETGQLERKKLLLFQLGDLREEWVKDSKQLPAIMNEVTFYITEDKNFFPNLNEFSPEDDVDVDPSIIGALCQDLCRLCSNANNFFELMGAPQNIQFGFHTSSLREIRTWANENQYDIHLASELDTGYVFIDARNSDGTEPSESEFAKDFLNPDLDVQFNRLESGRFVMFFQEFYSKNQQGLFQSSVQRTNNPALNMVSMLLTVQR